MQLIIKDNYEDAAYWTAAHIAYSIQKHCNSQKPFVLGLPTGSTPLAVYRFLIEMCNQKKVSFRNVVTFNMDEYVGLSAAHPQSYHTFMWENFFNYIDIPAGNVNILNGNAKDLRLECEQYEDKIKSFGGIDLFLGGVGADGHIAFNEPGSSLQSATRIKTLNEETVLANSRFFNSADEVPRQALTVGVGTIMNAREVVIIATGHQKARALQQAVEGSVNHLWTITALQLHQRATIVCDEEAVSELKMCTYRYFKGLEKHFHLNQ